MALDFGKLFDEEDISTRELIDIGYIKHMKLLN